MDNNQTNRLTKTAVVEYQAKLEDMKTVKRLEIAEQIQTARDFGDISENAEYDAAMDSQAKLEYDIAQLEELLSNVEVIDGRGIDTSKVNIGARVTLFSIDNNIEELFDIVSTSESEPFSRMMKIECTGSTSNKKRGFAKGDIAEILLPSKLSTESPVGKAIMGKKKGTQVDVTLPTVIKKYKIISIGISEELPNGKVLSEKIIL